MAPFLGFSGMTWFILALIAAALQTAADSTSKYLGKKASEPALLLGIFATPLLFLTPLLALTPQTEIQVAFWPYLLLVVILEIFAAVLFTKAIRSTDLSLALPLQMLTPMVLLITAPLLLAEIPSLIGVVGIVLIAVGSYVLNARGNQGSALQPFYELVHHRGTRYMLIAACIWGLTGSLHKLCIINSSPLFYSFANRCLATVFVGLTVALLRPNAFKEIKKYLPYFLLLGLFGSLISICTFTAMSSGLAVYVIAVKRASVLFGVLVGCYLFREFGLKERFTGAAIMTLGALLTNF